MLSSRWPRSPSHGKCSRRFCGSSRNCGRSRHQRRREAFEGHAFKSNRQKECVQMPGKMARSDPRLSVRITRGAGSGHTSRLSFKRAGEARTLMPVWDSSGESRLKAAIEAIDSTIHDEEGAAILTNNANGIFLDRIIGGPPATIKVSVSEIRRQTIRATYSRSLIDFFFSL